MSHYMDNRVRGALVLTRKVGQSVVIDGGKIRVTVVAVNGNQIRLAFEAPGLVVDREEIHNAKVVERGKSQQSQTPQEEASRGEGREEGKEQSS